MDLSQILSQLPPETITQLINQYVSEQNRGDGNQDHFRNKFEVVGDVRPKQPPHYQSSPPVWQDKFVLGMVGTNSLRYWTEVRAWVKAPNQAFPSSAVMLSLVNGKGSVFTRLTDPSELEALATKLSLWANDIRQKLLELKPLEAQYKAAQDAYNTAMNLHKLDSMDIGDSRNEY